MSLISHDVFRKISDDVHKYYLESPGSKCYFDRFAQIRKKPADHVCNTECRKMPYYAFYIKHTFALLEYIKTNNPCHVNIVDLFLKDMDVGDEIWEVEGSSLSIGINISVGNASISIGTWDDDMDIAGNQESCKGSQIFYEHLDIITFLHLYINNASPVCQKFKYEESIVDIWNDIKFAEYAEPIKYSDEQKRDMIHEYSEEELIDVMEKFDWKKIYEKLFGIENTYKPQQDEIMVKPGYAFGH